MRPHQLARFLVGPTWSVMVRPLGRLGRAFDLSWSYSSCSATMVLSCLGSCNMAVN